MKIFRSAHSLQTWALAQRAAGRSIALVPTMGYLHEGHLSLVAKARSSADLTVVSIFVNPIQFGPNEDYAAYPRDEKADLAKCRDAGADAVFLPTPETMYASDASVTIEESVLADRLCGARRPGHFRGVCTVVAKLFNLSQANVAIFGQKDFQQAAVIKRMVRDLDFPIKIAVSPIVRESSGLARSSRNTYLSAEERARAVALSQALKLAKKMLASGESSAETVRRAMTQHIEAAGLKVDYVEIIDAQNLDPVQVVRKGDAALVAAYCGKTRLIDNAVL